MEYRQLGSSGLRVSLLSFGTMTFGGGGSWTGIGQTDAVEAARQVAACMDAGVNLFDTADVYSEGRSEEILAEALGGKRTDVLIATKFFGRTGPGVNDGGGSRHHIIRSCEGSLRRLKTDYIDLYQMHGQDMTTPPEETLRALDDLITSGKVRYVGSSNHSGWTKMRALATSDRLRLARYVSQQIQYSLLVRDAEAELLPLGVHEGVGALVWGPLASGYLTGKFNDGTVLAPTRLGQNGRLSGRDTERARQIVDRIQEIAGEHEGATPTQVALNWVVRRAGVSSIIVGARTIEQLSDNLAAATWSLSDEEMAALDTASTTPLSYPYHMHADFASERNPRPSLLPQVKWKR